MSRREYLREREKERERERKREGEGQGERRKVMNDSQSQESKKVNKKEEGTAKVSLCFIQAPITTSPSSSA
jgi:hypothetical protein